MERIDYAAVKIYPYDLNTPMIITGLRHPEIYEYLWEKGIRFEKDKAEEGFLTNTNIFVDRYKARTIVFKANQIKEIPTAPLYSEDLW